MNSKKVLFLATLDITIYAFLIPHMKLLKNMGYEVECGCRDTGFLKNIEQNGFKVYDIPFYRNPFSASNFKAIFHLNKIMSENKYVLLHTHTPIASFIGRILGRINHVPKVVYTVHGFHFHEYGNPLKNFLYYNLERFAGNFTDVLITINSDDYKFALEKRIVPKGRVVYIKGVGVDTEIFNPEKLAREKLETIDKFSHKKVFVSVGRLENEKHFDQLIRAFSLVGRRNKGFELLIIGDGENLQILKKLLKFLSLDDKIKLLGYVKGVEYYLSDSFAFVFTSSREGLPVSVMEAMAMEKPVIAYNIRGVRDLVIDGVTGFLVKYGDIKGLSEKIVYLMEHEEIAKEMGKRGRERIEREFSLNVILPQMEMLYCEILKENG
ncbi:MAG: glycosyltransferase family 4 protein [Candidatus Parvarchaeota archaeon]|nr:glycosyltransferase family 4 protein [Candidatus Rehaiarchaeum fermentans]